MKRDSIAAIAALLAVAVVAILGFRFLGSPSSQRMIQSDVRTLQAMHQLAFQIQTEFHAAQNQLPATLDGIRDADRRNPITHKLFIYKPKSKSEYDLCATFVAPTPEVQPNSARPVEDEWRHPAGDFCFSLDASQRIPPAPYFY